MSRYLEDMLTAKRTISWPVSDPELVARRIREALYASRCHEDFRNYHKLKEWFRLRSRPGWVEAEYIGPLVGATPVYSPGSMTIGEADDVNGVVGACIKLAAKAEELHFPNARLSDEEQLQV